MAVHVQLNVIVSVAAADTATATDFDTPPSCFHRRTSSLGACRHDLVRLLLGGNLGAAFDRNDLSIKDLSEEQDLTLKFSNDTELIGGVQAGYNWQMGSWLLGVEGDFDFAEDISYLASVRGRVGWAFGSWLLYGTGGVAFIDTDNDFVVVSADAGPFSFSNGNTDTGFVVVGGMDYKLAAHLSLGWRVSCMTSAPIARPWLLVTSPSF